MNRLNLVEGILKLSRHLLNEETIPSFFELDKDSNFDRTRKHEPPSEIEYKELKRGTQDHLLGDTPPYDPDREMIVVTFRDRAQVLDAESVLGRSSVGHPTYDIGSDGKSFIFYPWKGTEKDRKRIQDAIKILKDKGLTFSTEVHPFVRKF
jgi:hypothetical protein